MTVTNSQIDVHANTLGFEGETPSTLTTVECQPTTTGTATPVVATMQKQPIVVPADVSGLSPTQPFQEVKQLAYGGSKEAQQQKFNMILDDFEGLLQMAQGVTSEASPGGWKTDYVTDIARVNNIVTLVRGEDITGVDWANATDNQKLALLLNTPIGDFSGIKTVEMFTLPGDPEINLLQEKDYTNLTDADVRSILAQKLPYEEGTTATTTSLSSNSYFMLVLALAIAQMKLGYSIAGEVQCGMAPVQASCKARRCYQVPDAPIPIRIGILGVLPIIDGNTTILQVLDSTFTTMSADNDTDAQIAHQASLQLECLLSQLGMVYENTAVGNAKDALQTKIQALKETLNQLKSWVDPTPLLPLLNDAYLGFLNTSDSDRTPALSRVIQTYPLLPPSSDPINRIRGTRNADIMEAYAMNKAGIQQQATPYYYRGGAAVCNRRLPLVGLSRECPSWNPEANNVVPFVECNCEASPPPLPTTCSCKPTPRIESVLALVRKSGPQLDLATMLLGFNVNWLANVVEDLANASIYYTAAQKAIGYTIIRDALESNSQVFIPGAAGAFYTNLMEAQDTSDTLPACFYQGNDSKTARAIAERVVEGQSIPITTKIALQQRIFDRAANQMVAPAANSGSALPAVALAVQEEAHQVAADYDAANNPINTFTASVSRMYELDPVSPAGVALEGRSVGVQLVDNIVVTVPLTYSLKDKVADALAAASDNDHSTTSQALDAAKTVHTDAVTDHTDANTAYQVALAAQAADTTNDTALQDAVDNALAVLIAAATDLATAATDLATAQTAHDNTLVRKLETLASEMHGYLLEADSVACQGCASCP